MRLKYIKTTKILVRKNVNKLLCLVRHSLYDQMFCKIFRSFVKKCKIKCSLISFVIAPL